MRITGINIGNVKGVLRGAMGRILRNATGDLRVVQIEQWDNAFKNSGQPSAKWKPLWANTFKGSVSHDNKQGILTATNRLATARSRVLTAKQGQAEKALKKQDKAKSDLVKAIEKAKPSESYRKGGKPLRDNGFLMASRFTKYAFVFEGESTTIIVIASNAIYAGWQHSGFKTKGPNFIPLTLKARRRHVLHQNPFLEGLEYGVDYIMAWHGVDVPARPIIDYADPVNRKQIGDVIRHSIKKG